jgi:hypothetical protein
MFSVHHRTYRLFRPSACDSIGATAGRGFVRSEVRIVGKSLFALAVLLTALSLAAAQDKPDAKKATPDKPAAKTDAPEKEPVIVKASMPRYYKSLGLSDKQKKAVFKVRADYAAKLADLQRQLEALKDQEKADLENVLTDAQRARLKELRAGADSKK